MGKYRSKNGCLTCRTRRVKCDEGHPICGQCGKKKRECRWEPAGVDIRQYQPNEASAADGVDGLDGVDGMRGGEGREYQREYHGSDEEQKLPHSPLRRKSRAGERQAAPFASFAPEASTSTPLHYRSGTSSSLLSSAASPAGFSEFGLRTYAPLPAHPSPEVALSHQDAEAVHHFAQHLGRWLDCTDASRQFTLRVPVLVKYCPILLHAVLCFAAKHRQNLALAEELYNHCIGILVKRLDSPNVPYDDALLCAIVILRYVEQLNVSLTGGDFQQHLSGCSAIVRAAQEATVDPSAPTLRQAAFWVYVRQCLYTASVNQKLPNLDTTMQLIPDALQIDPSNPLLALARETAWANTIAWLCARVLHFCFDGIGDLSAFKPALRLQQWEELSENVKSWGNERPASFDPIWSGPAGESSVFPVIFFTADWHVIAFVLYHFSCILLLTYKPGARFAARNVGAKLRESDQQILHHAQTMCGACLCTTQNVSVSIMLCHTVFMWGPIMSDQGERDALLKLLADLESTHSWPTSSTRDALKEEWDM